MPDRTTPPGLSARHLCAGSLDWAVRHGLVPSYVPTGRYRRRADPPHRLDFGKDTWLLAHYADWRGPLYADETAWRGAFSFVRAFLATSLGDRNSRRWRLDKIFGSFGNLDPPSVLTRVRSGLLREGFHVTDLDEMSGTAVFHQTDSCEVGQLPEPYGKWVQRERDRLPWENKVDLNVETRCRVYVQRRLTPPYDDRTLLDLELSAPAAHLLPRLRQHLAGTLRTPALLDPHSETNLESDMVASLRRLMSTW